MAKNNSKKSNVNPTGRGCGPYFQNQKNKKETAEDLLRSLYRGSRRQRSIRRMESQYHG